MSNGKAGLEPTTLLPHTRCAHRAYRMTCKEFDQLRVRASDRCEICGTGAADTLRKVLFIDHDPLLGKWAVRGLLCNSCNTSLSLKSRPDTPGVRRYLADPWRVTEPVRRYRSPHLADSSPRMTFVARPDMPAETVRSLERIIELGRRHRQVKAALEQLRPEKEIGELVGLTRESIRQICLASARRRYLRSEAASQGNA